MGSEMCIRDSLSQTFDVSRFDIPGKLAALRSLPNQEVLHYELQFVYLGGMM